MVIIIVLNLIFGVIIDTFADLRSEKQKKEEILKTTCFICGACSPGAPPGAPPWGASPGSKWVPMDPTPQGPVCRKERGAGSRRVIADRLV